ncbi:MAG: conjugal transfer protein [Erythrobacter sp.]
MKRKTLPDVICLPHGSAANWRAPISRRRLAAVSGVVLFLAGCTTLGTNINGSFTCGPSDEGSCAPATVIDNRALVEITGDTSYIPAGPYQAPVRPMPPGTVALAAAQPAQVVPGEQKVLRIVFPAQFDRAGRYHETSVVQAVVDTGQWIKASPSDEVAMAPSINLTVNPEILSALGNDVTAASAASAVTPRLGLNDPPLPSAQAVAAARARGAANAAKSGEGEGGETPVNRPQGFNPVVEQ